MPMRRLAMRSGVFKLTSELQEVTPVLDSRSACEGGSPEPLLEEADEYGAASLEALDRLDAWVTSGSHLRYLNGLMLDKEQCCALAANSRMHPNGFLKLALSMPRRGCSLRLHVWRSAASSGDIHNHINDYSSRLLLGRLSIRRFEISQNGRAYQKFIASRGNRSESYQLKPSGEVTLAQVQEFIQTRHDHMSYSQEAQVIHSVVPSSSIAVTLFLFGAPCRLTSDVFRLGGSRPQYSEAKPVSPGSYIRHIGAVARYINYLYTTTV